MCRDCLVDWQIAIDFHQYEFKRRVVEPTCHSCNYGMLQAVYINLDMGWRRGAACSIISSSGGGKVALAELDFYWCQIGFNRFAESMAGAATFKPAKVEFIEARIFSNCHAIS